MPLKPLTKWTPQLREALFKFKGKDLWTLEDIAKKTDEEIKNLRQRGGLGTLEDINYLKAKKQAAQEEIERIRGAVGEDKFRAAMQPKATENYRMRW